MLIKCHHVVLALMLTVSSKALNTDCVIRIRTANSARSEVNEYLLEFFLSGPRRRLYECGVRLTMHVLSEERTLRKFQSLIWMIPFPCHPISLDLLCSPGGEVGGVAEVCTKGTKSSGKRTRSTSCDRE